VHSTVKNLEVLYEDNHIIAINKRSGDLVQGDHTGDAPLSEIVKEWIRIKYQKPGNVFTGVAHRIDRPVSGVVIFAKTGKALSRLNEMFKTKEVDKTYYAAVCSMPKSPSDTLTSYLIKDSSKNKSRASKTPKTGAKEAILDYEHIYSSDRYFFLKVKPRTGRHHQIRVQLSEIGCQIKGDVKYGAPRTNKDASIHLHARSIAFIHPVKKEPLIISAPFPNDPVWNSLPDRIG
jgi:23S rRNA pseudouridine1911/1915/1917 synthase